MQKIILTIIVYAFFTAVHCASAMTGNATAIIPVPAEISLHDGQFQLTAATRIIFDPEFNGEARLLAAQLRPATGYPLPILPSNANLATGDILLSSIGASPSLSPEGYELRITADTVVIKSTASAGAFYGSQSFMQLLPPEIFSSKVESGIAWHAPCLRIRDHPRFQWRGLMLDVSRHFFTRQEVEQLLDEMALHKLNVFHWHLADDQGWRIEITKYPKLTSIGAWRSGIGFGLEPNSSNAYGPDGRYGGFYTQEDIREIVKFAAARHITIVPEIEMPGHSMAALAAYPQFSCTGGPFATPTVGGVFNGVYCPASDATFGFLDEVLGEVCLLFPGKYIHIGGDEVPRDEWEASPKCQAMMKRLGLKSEDEVQAWFIRRIKSSLDARGKQLIGWSEILKGGLTRDATVMDWLGDAAEALNSGHDVVMTPTDFCYFDRYQSTDRFAEPFSSGFLPLERVYNYEPVSPRLSVQAQGHILGVQGNLWTEEVPDFPQAEYMIFPRACALAEVAWSPKATHDWNDFSRRLIVHEKRLSLLGVNYRRPGGLREIGSKITEPPVPFGAIPTSRQLEWQRMEFSGFLHFGVNTFTGREWGYGDESEKAFNPSEFDADQIVEAAKLAGMKGLILTCKHHDGFCLWPSSFTDHSVKNSPWENGQGDVVKAISDACRRHGVKFGIYLSPWDRSRADYGRPSYISYYRNQLRELLSNYGPIFEVWLDGANGGDGFYGGAREMRVIDRKTYYDWPNTWSIVRQLQPNACIFSDAGPDARWVGNETGQAGKTCWATINASQNAPGMASEAQLNQGDRFGADWMPAECDVSIRPGWFYHPAEDQKVKTPQQLFDLYFDSVGRGASLLLNIPIDSRGRIHDGDLQSLRGFHQVLDDLFSRDMAQDALATASNVRGDDPHFSPAKVLDNLAATYWSTDDGITSANLVLTFASPVTFDVVRLREYLPLGQRVGEFALDQSQNGDWTQFASGTSIGNCRLLRTARVTTTKVRLRIVKSAACPAIAELGLFSQ